MPSKREMVDTNRCKTFFPLPFYPKQTFLRGEGALPSYRPGARMPTLTDGPRSAPAASLCVNSPRKDGMPRPQSLTEEVDACTRAARAATEASLPPSSLPFRRRANIYLYGNSLSSLTRSARSLSTQRMRSSRGCSAHIRRRPKWLRGGSDMVSFKSLFQQY